MAMKQLRRDNTGAGPRRCRSPPIVTTVVEGERRSPGSSSWRSSIRELPSLSQAGTGSRTMAPRGWRQRRKALWSGEAIVTNFEGAEKSDRVEKSSIHEIPNFGEAPSFSARLHHRAMLQVARLKTKGRRRRRRSGTRVQRTQPSSSSRRMSARRMRSSRLMLPGLSRTLPAPRLGS